MSSVRCHSQLPPSRNGDCNLVNKIQMDRFLPRFEMQKIICEWLSLNHWEENSGIITTWLLAWNHEISTCISYVKIKWHMNMTYQWHNYISTVNGSIKFKKNCIPFDLSCFAQCCVINLIFFKYQTFSAVIDLLTFLLSSRLEIHVTIYSM